MKALAYRMNRATFGLMLAFMVVAYAVMIKLMDKPPGAEIIVMVLLVPRLHDLGRSGWWAVALVGIEIVFILAGASMAGTQGIQIAGGLFVLVALVGLVVLALIPGQDVINRWGAPPPRGIQWKKPKPEAVAPTAP